MKWSIILTIALGALVSAHGPDGDGDDMPAPPKPVSPPGGTPTIPGSPTLPDPKMPPPKGDQGHGGPAGGHDHGGRF
ncbi:hypothetical protein FKW77_003643 [Venturia effusa]|uniref:Uncharacterized protein n=1 Tax=Venturia effusa TaxID=50376 RepID=A0A517LPW0_9PEZI|nr:hypothetical protein FKW77_003643 [Venturia effusa]